MGEDADRVRRAAKSGWLAILAGVWWVAGACQGPASDLDGGDASASGLAGVQAAASGRTGRPKCGPPQLAPIVFAARLAADTSTNLYLVRPDGTGLERLCDTPQTERYPRWSPGRDRVAFVRDNRLFVVDATGARETLVAPRVGRNGQAVTAPDWSPDGRRLVYPFPRPPFVIGSGDEAVDQSYDTTLHIVDVDGGGGEGIPFPEPPETGLPPGLGTLIEPAWSADGRLAFNVLDDCPDCAGGSYYAVAQPDGSELRMVPVVEPGQLYPVHGLDWSADGGRWVYTAFAEYADYESPGVIVTSSSAHDDPRAITGPGAWMPHWSPDGRWIAFLRPDGIYVVRADGCSERRILEASQVRGLDW